MSDLSSVRSRRISASRDSKDSRRDHRAALSGAVFPPGCRAWPLSTLSRCSGSHPSATDKASSVRRAAAALDRVPLEFPHDGHGHVRAPGKLTLAPAELADTAADSPGNRSPVLRIAFRHAFLRAPLPAPRLAVHFVTPHQAETSRKQTKAFRNI